MIGVYANCFTGFRIAVDQPDSSNRKRTFSRSLPIANGNSGSTRVPLPIANGCFNRNPSNRKRRLRERRIRPSNNAIRTASTALWYRYWVPPVLAVRGT